MESSLSAHAPAFRKALDDFQFSLAQNDRDLFKYTTLADLQRSILEIQAKHASERKTKNMARLNSFLEAMEQYGKVIEVFLNASEFIAFVWGPAKFLLQVASTFTEAFDELLDAYNDIGESLPMLSQYESLFKGKGYMGKVLELIYFDILEFHHKAYKYFKQRAWKQMFRACWKTFRSRFKPVLENLRRHKALVETQASLYQFEEIQQMRVTVEAEFQAFREAEDLRRRSAVQDWLSAANTELDQEIKSSDRTEYPGVCHWILDHKNVQAWRGSSSRSSPLLWVNGIPGAGKTTLASFLIDHLRTIPSTHVLFFYCKHEDKNRNSFVALARAIISQAVTQNDSLLSYVYEEAATSSEKPLNTLKRSQEILEVALKSLDKAYLIIDGLDECPPNEKKIIAPWLQTLVLSLSENDHAPMKCIFFSQSDKETGKLFKGLLSVSIHSADLNGDIMTFCKIEAQKIRQKFDLPDSETEEIIQKVSHEAKDMFLYAKLVMKNLFGQTRLANLRKEMQPGQFPKGIKQAYGRIVERILDPESTECEDAKLLLGLLVCAKRPLRWTEIQGAISIDLDTKTVDLEGRSFRVGSKELCGSLVEIRSGGTVELVHMTAKRYLVHHKFIFLEKEELDLTHLCLQYLSMDWFDYGIAEQPMQEFIKTGHYSFAEYAIAYWAEHLLGAITSADVSSLELLAVAIRGFLEAHFSPTASKQTIPKSIEKIINKYQTYEFHNDLGQAIALLEARKLSNQNRENVINNLGLEEILSRIRSLMESMSISEGNKESLQKIYGTNIFKCSRIDCKGFFDGFPERSECQQHQKRHDRQFYCTFEGCVAAKSGFTSSRELERHFERLHGSSGTPSFPCYQIPDHLAVREAIKDANIPVIENYCQNRLDSAGYIKFSDNRRWLWESAMRHPDDEVLSLLIPYTNFSETSAQREILQYAVRAKQVDQVRKFAHDRYRQIRTAGQAEWTIAITASISLNNVDMLRILVDKQLSTLNPKGLEQMRYHLVESCIFGRLSCVQYLVSECGLDPFKHNEQGPPKNIISISSWRVNSNRMTDHYVRDNRETRNHSALYNAITTGHQNVVKYLLTFRDDRRFSRPEESQILLKAAASNGFEEILQTIADLKDDVDESVVRNCTIVAKLYNAVRLGNGQLVKEMLPLGDLDYDLPDRNGCSLLMYAALNGLDSVVEHVIQKGADINRSGHCSEVTARTVPTQTALVLATFNGNASIVERLLQCSGIELAGWIIPRSSTKGVRGEQDIFSVAKLKGYENISQLLENHKHKTKTVGSPSQSQDQRGAAVLTTYNSQAYQSLFNQIWKDIAKKDLPKAWRIKENSLATKQSNLRKTAQLASKEARRWQLRTNKSIKDVQAQAKRSMREMLLFWKRNERDERD